MAIIVDQNQASLMVNNHVVLDHFKDKAPSEKVGSPTFEEVYKQYAAMVRRVQARLVPYDDLDDAVQETFIKIHKALPGFHHESKLETWIYRIAINCARDYQRKLFSFKKLRELVSKTEQSTEDDQMDYANEAREILDQIPLKYKVVATLHYLEEKSLLEIASITGLPMGTVKSRLFYARKKMQDISKEVNHGAR